MSNLTSVIFLGKTTDVKVRRLRHKCRESILSDPIKVELPRTYVKIILGLRNQNSCVTFIPMSDFKIVEGPL